MYLITVLQIFNKQLDITKELYSLSSSLQGPIIGIGILACTVAKDSTTWIN